MIYSSNEKGEGVLTLTPEEKVAFESGKPVFRMSGDRLGRFSIMAKLTRPALRALRYPVEEYGPNYKPDKNPVSASVQLKADREAWMREQADKLYSEYDFGGTVLDSDGWEYNSSDPDFLRCEVYLENEDPDGDSIQVKFVVEFRGDKPFAEVY